MTPNLAQERNVGECVKPFGVVYHHCVGRTVAKGQELAEYSFDAIHVGFYAFVVDQLAARILARRIAYLGGAAAHQDDRLVTRSLPPAQQHDRHQRADMQAVGGAIESEIAQLGLAFGKSGV